MRGEETRAIAGHDGVGVGIQAGAGWELEGDAVDESPARQVHSLGGAVVELDKLQPGIVVDGVVEDLIQDDFRGVGCRGVPGRVWRAVGVESHRSGTGRFGLSGGATDRRGCGPGAGIAFSPRGCGEDEGVAVEWGGGPGWGRVVFDLQQYGAGGTAESHRAAFGMD